VESLATVCSIPAVPNGRGGAVKERKMEEEGGEEEEVYWHSRESAQSPKQ